MDHLPLGATIIQSCWFQSCHVLGEMVGEAGGIGWIGVEMPTITT